MIHSIRSDLPSFKELRFQPGLNILLAEKSPGATERQTRNRAGKTSLIELIHFLIGANCDARSLFKNDALVQFSFEMDFDLNGAQAVVKRSGQKPSRIVIAEGDTQTWPIVPHLDQSAGELVISNTDWKTVLGRLVFGLGNSTGSDEQPDKFGPTFRSLFAYFVRRQLAEAFLSPMRQSEQQQTGDQQVALSYLLGVDWGIPHQWQLLREREKTLRSLRKAAGEETLRSVIGTTADLRTKLTLAEEHSRRLKEVVSKFSVLPEYRDLEIEASKITRQLGSFSDDNTINRQLIAELEQALEEEAAPHLPDLERLYNEIGQVLPDAVLKRFDDVKNFHDSVIHNRRSYLSGEIDAARQRITQSEGEMRRLDARRAEIMNILNAHGALDHFNHLQTELSRVEAEAETLRRRFVAAEQLEESKTEMEIERGQLLLRLRQDYHEQEEVLKQAILAFEQTSKALYEEAGSLTINPSQNGPMFDVKIQGAKSKGISNMQIFCFDMMLMRIGVKREIGPGFLVHDSHLFDGVDERQVGRALFVGAKAAKEFGFQYIVTMNSDAMPVTLPKDFNLDNFILPVRLTDATEDGGLFGIRFE